MTASRATTTQAAFLLNISTGRLRTLINQGRVHGAEKVKGIWLIPINRRGIPDIIPGRRGPQPTWNKEERTANTFIHVLRKTIDYNRDYGTSYPAVAVKVGNKKDYCHAVKIHGSCQIVYQPHQPNRSQAGGARLWIEVEPQNIVERIYFSDGDYGPPPEVTEQREKLKQARLKNQNPTKKNPTKKNPTKKNPTKKKSKTKEKRK